MNKTQVLAIFVKLTLFYRGECSPKNEQNEQNPGFVHFWPPHQINKKDKMNKTRVLAIFLKLSLFYRGNVTQKNEQTEQNEQNPGFVHFCSPHQINKTNKINKTRVSALSPLTRPPKRGGRGQFKPLTHPPKKGGEVRGQFKPLNPPPQNAQSLYMLGVNNSTLWGLLSMTEG